MSTKKVSADSPKTPLDEKAITQAMDAMISEYISSSSPSQKARARALAVDIIKLASTNTASYRILKKTPSRLQLQIRQEARIETLINSLIKISQDVVVEIDGDKLTFTPKSNSPIPPSQTPPTLPELEWIKLSIIDNKVIEFEIVYDVFFSCDDEDGLIRQGVLYKDGEFYITDEYVQDGKIEQRNTKPNRIHLNLKAIMGMNKEGKKYIENICKLVAHIRAINLPTTTVPTTSPRLNSATLAVPHTLK